MGGAAPGRRDAAGEGGSGDTLRARRIELAHCDPHDGAPSTFTLRAVVPANTTAELWLPGATKAVDVGSGEHELSMELSAAQRHRYLPSREGARLHVDTPLAEVLADEPARTILTATAPLVF